MDTKSILLNVVGAVAALALVALTFVNTIALFAAIAVAVGLLLLVYLGPERLGTVLVIGGVFLTPQNDIRPLSAPSFSWCDILLVLGFGLLLPRLLSNRSHVPTLFATGAVGVFVTSIASSLVAPDAGASAYWGGFFIGAVVALPLLFCLYGPDRKLMIWLASAFVAGQVVSTLYAIATGVGPSGRYEGTTFQPNYFAVGGLMAVALCTFLYQAAKPGLLRWVILGAGGLSVAAIYMSGSRGVLLGLIAVALVYPLVERSVLSAYLLIALTLGIVPLLGLIAAAVDEDSALGRLLGKDPTASGSNDIRRDSLTDGWHRFLDSPILGSGFEGNLTYHNIFLQVPVAIGVLGFAAWLVMITAFVMPLFGNSPFRRIGYVALAYLSIGLTEPLLFDRSGWVPMSLALVAALTPGSNADEPADEASADPTRTPRSAGPHSPAPST
jgi:hypothetical protein